MTGTNFSNTNIHTQGHRFIHGQALFDAGIDQPGGNRQVLAVSLLLVNEVKEKLYIDIYVSIYSKIRVPTSENAYIMLLEDKFICSYISIID